MSHFRNTSSCAVGRVNLTRWGLRKKKTSPRLQPSSSHAVQSVHKSESSVLKSELDHKSRALQHCHIWRDGWKRTCRPETFWSCAREISNTIQVQVWAASPGQDWSEASNNSGSEVWQYCWQTCLSSNLYVLYMNAAPSGRNNLFQKCHASYGRALILNRFHPFGSFGSFFYFWPNDGPSFLLGYVHYALRTWVFSLEARQALNTSSPTVSRSALPKSVWPSFFSPTVGSLSPSSQEWRWLKWCDTPANRHLIPSKLTRKHLTTNDLLIKEVDRFTIVKWHWQFRPF